MAYIPDSECPIAITVEEFLEKNPGIVDKIKYMTPKEAEEKITDVLYPSSEYSWAELDRFVRTYIPDDNIPAYNRLWFNIGMDINDDGTWKKG